MKIHKGDQVLLISGKDKGRKGKVLEVFPKKGRLVVEGVNLRKKHVRAKKQGEKGQIVTVPVPFDASNAKLICPKCKKPSRITFRIEKKRKYRVCKKCGQEI